MERVRKHRSRPEDVIQRAVIQHLRQRGRAGIFFFHVPNGGKRKPIEAAILKGLGVRAGVPDIFVVKPVMVGPMLMGQTYALELKADKGRVSDNQDEAMLALKQAGAFVAVTHGLDAAIKQLEDWQLLRGRAAA